MKTYFKSLVFLVITMVTLLSVSCEKEDDTDLVPTPIITDTIYKAEFVVKDTLTGTITIESPLKIIIGGDTTKVDITYSINGNTQPLKDLKHTTIGTDLVYDINYTDIDTLIIRNFDNSSIRKITITSKHKLQ